VDLHAGRVTRPHADIDVAVWQSDLTRVRAVLTADGWVPASRTEEDGYVALTRDGVMLELAFLARDQSGRVYTPSLQGEGSWPPGSFGTARGDLDGIRARVVSLESLVADKSEPRDEAAVAAKDHADVVVLRSLVADRAFHYAGPPEPAVTGR
jgi:hypothetical protein